MIRRLKELYRLFLSDSSIGQFLRYAFVGTLNTIVGYGVYWILLQLNVHYIAATAVSSVIAILHSYIWNRNFAFKSKNKGTKKTFAELLRFCSVYAVQYLISIGFTALFVEKINMTPEIGGFISMLLCTVISYVGHKYWSFHSRGKSAQDTTDKR